MNIKAFVADWLAAANAYDTGKFLMAFHPTAVLDDPSVGTSFAGHEGIRQYFEDYFIGYQTQTRLIKIDHITGHSAHLEVEFKGNFPGKKLAGIFYLEFKAGKIIAAKADLL